MIEENKLVHVGFISKLHGINGALEAKTTDELLLLIEPRQIVLKLSELFVPFTVEKISRKNHTACYLTLKYIASEHEALPLLNAPIYIDSATVDKKRAQLLDDDATELEDIASLFVGYEVYNKDEKYIGKIQSVDMSTLNSLMILDNGTMLPLHPDFVLGHDIALRQLIIDIDDDLLSLN